MLKGRRSKGEFRKCYFHETNHIDANKTKIENSDKSTQSSLDKKTESSKLLAIEGLDAILEIEFEKRIKIE